MGSQIPRLPHKSNEKTQQNPKINHERFLNYTIKIGKDNQDLILTKMALPRKNQYDEWVEQLIKINYLQALFVPKAYIFKKQGLCGSTGMAQLIFQNYPFLLIDEINNRQCMSNKNFQETQLWYLAFVLLSAAGYFHGMGQKVGDIRPENIFISEDGSVKVACRYSWPLQRTNYQKSFQKQITYIAPEEYNDLRFGKTQTSANIQLAQTFSIGLTLLDAAILSHSHDLYKSKKNIDYEGLQKKLQLLDKKQHYNTVFKALVRNMCQINPQARTSARQLLEWLKPYEAAINQFQQFDPQEIPQKFQLVLNKTSLRMSNNFPPVSSSIYNNSVPSNISFQMPQPNSNFTFNPNPLPPTGLTLGNGINLPYKPPQTQPLTYVNTGSTITPNVYNPPSFYVYSNPQNPQEGVATYNGKFSLQQLDAQLEQSRKLFPS